MRTDGVLDLLRLSVLVDVFRGSENWLRYHVVMATRVSSVELCVTC